MTALLCPGDKAASGGLTLSQNGVSGFQRTRGTQDSFVPKAGPGESKKGQGSRVLAQFQQHRMLRYAAECQQPSASPARATEAELLWTS